MPDMKNANRHLLNTAPAANSMPHQATMTNIQISH
jgi:hypothetical protein